MSTVGVIGLGLLGQALVDRLLSQSPDLQIRGFDIDKTRRDHFRKLGCQACDQVQEVFHNCERVFLSLPNSRVVAQLIRENRASLQAGTCLLDTSTGDPQEMIQNGQQLASLEVDYLETNVAGSSQQLRTGQAVIFVGGEAALASRMQNLLETLAERHYYLGAVGRASSFKLVHNLVLGLNRAALAEGLAFAEGLDFDLQQTLEVLQHTPASSAVMHTKGPKMVAGDFEPDARMAQHLKDVRLIAAEAARAEIWTPLTELHESLLEKGLSLGWGEADNSAILAALRNQKADSHS